ncbi:MAG TPA: hypothetical protein PK443_05110 [bacterium]|nr:hypothetical protein [bacterium]
MKITSANLIVRDKNSPNIVNLFGTPPACDSFTGTPVNNQAYDILGCETLGNVTANQYWYLTGIIKNTTQLYLSSRPTEPNDPNERTPLDSEDDLWTLLIKE